MLPTAPLPSHETLTAPNRKSPQSQNLLLWWPGTPAGQTDLRDRGPTGLHTATRSGTGTPHLIEPAAGRHCPQYNGTDDAHQTTLPADITYANPLTVMWWSRDRAAGALRCILNIQATGDAGQILRVYYSSTSNGLIVGRKRDQSLTVAPQTPIDTALRHHYAITCPGGDVQPTLYIDGRPNSAPYANYLAADQSNVISLAYGFGGAYRANMVLDDLRVHTAVLPAHIIYHAYAAQTRNQLRTPTRGLPPPESLPPEEPPSTPLRPYLRYCQYNLARWRRDLAPSTRYPATEWGTLPSKPTLNIQTGPRCAILTITPRAVEPTWGWIIHRSDTTPFDADWKHTIALIPHTPGTTPQYLDAPPQPGTWYYAVQPFHTTGLAGPPSDIQTAIIG